MQKARLLVEDAIKLRLADTVIQTLSQRVLLLEDLNQNQHQSYTNLLNLSEQKFEKQKEITADFVRLSESWREESEYYQKRYRKQRRQKTFLTAGVVVLIGLVVLK